MTNIQSAGIAAGIVESSLTEVAALLLDVQPGKFSGQQLPLVIDGVAAAVEIQGGPQKFTVLAGEGPTLTRLCFIEVDQANHRISIYGGWWFKGEYSIKPHAKGCLLTYQLSNAASGVSGAIAGWLHRRELKAAGSTLEGMLHRLGERLGCSAYITDGYRTHPRIA